MARYEVEFDSDGKITVKDPEFIRRLRLMLAQEQRLTLSLAPNDPREIDLMNVKCPPEASCPDPLLKSCPDRILAKCPDPMDLQCPMLFRKPVDTIVRNEWAFDAAWNAAGGPNGNGARGDRR